MIPYFVFDQFTLGFVKFYTWGLFVGLGFSAGYLLFYYLARHEGLAPAKVVGLALAIFAGAILGAKVLAFVLAGSGAMFMGGLVGAIVAGWGYVRIVNFYSPYPCPLLFKERDLTPQPPFTRGAKFQIKHSPFVQRGAGGLNLWQISDLLVLPILLGIAIGRIGCFLNNEHQGAPTGLPWGILWPDGIARHPVGIYELLIGFGLLVVFWFLQKKIWSPPLEGGTPKLKTGSIFLLFLISYSVIRFFLEFTRVSSGLLADPRWGIFSVSQWVAAIIFTISLALLIYKKKC